MYKKLLPAECGRAPLKFIDKIWGGHDTKITEHPWLVALMYWYKYGVENNKLMIQCGGSIITNRFVLTAVPCIKIRQPDFLRFGEYQTSTVDDCELTNGGERICSPRHLDVGVNKVFIHEDFIQNRRMMYNDIGLIKTSVTIMFNSDQNNRNIPLVLPICLPSINDQETKEISIPDDSRTFEIVGWGEKC